LIIPVFISKSRLRLYIIFKRNGLPFFSLLTTYIIMY